MVDGDVLGKGLDDDGELGLVVDLIAPVGKDDWSFGGALSPISVMWLA